MALDYTKAWRTILCCCIMCIFLISIDEAVMTHKSNMILKTVSIGQNLTLQLNETKHTSVAWMHNSSLLVLWENNVNKTSGRPNIYFQTPDSITITNARINDSGIYTALQFPPNRGLSTTRFNVTVSTVADIK
nr:glycoprotein vIgFam3 [Elephant endotheliotropic herpesvirus 1A]AYF58608.1 glycoprotein vIgFam3 [Elephant endotheliotropic herpesvirus 1A]